MTICSSTCADEWMVSVRRACVDERGRARQQLRDAHDAVHRRTQLMTHPVEEVAFRPRSLLELAIGLNQLAGSQD